MEQKIKEIIAEKPTAKVTFNLISGKSKTYDPLNGAIDIRSTYLQYFDNNRMVFIATDKIESIEID